MPQQPWDDLHRRSAGPERAAIPRARIAGRAASLPHAARLTKEPRRLRRPVRDVDVDLVPAAVVSERDLPGPPLARPRHLGVVILQLLEQDLVADRLQLLQVLVVRVLETAVPVALYELRRPFGRLSREGRVLDHREAR